MKKIYLFYLFYFIYTINDSVNFAGLLRSRTCLRFSHLLKAFVLLLKLIFHRKQGSFVKTRRLRNLYVERQMTILYVERKMTILWHMIMLNVPQERMCFQLSAMGAYRLYEGLDGV